MILSNKSLLLIFTLGLWCNSRQLPTVAQIVPDDSLGDEASIVTPEVMIKDAIADYIEGGAVRGNNLFHSFSEFSISELGQAYFATPPGIEQILTRVTGGNVSEILGTLGVDGNANLFFLNPNGIIFGQNAQLDIAGSFLATTADSYILPNGFNFSATAPATPPLLTVNMPVGLQLGSNPGSIINRARIEPLGFTEVADAIEFMPPEGLRIAPEQNLSLVGGEINLEGGYLNTSEGKIELGGVGANNIIKLRPDGHNWRLDYEDVSNFADININQLGGIDGGQTGGTEIILRGRNISLGYDFETLAESGFQPEDFFNLETSPNLDQLAPDRTRIQAQNQDHQTPALIDINASDTFSIIDPGRNSSIVDTTRNSHNIVAHTSGIGDAGIIDIAADSIVIYGASVESWTLAGATGNAGEINYTAQNMSMINAGAGVNTFSQGDGGTINLDIAQNLQFKSGGFGAIARDQGVGGTVHIKAQNLDIKFGGIGTGTFSTGDAGIIDLDIEDSLTITSGGFGSDAYGDGDGGRIQVKARNIELHAAGMGANTFGRGDGGEIDINAESILLKDGVISAESGENFDERDFVNENLTIPIGETNAGNGGSILIKAENLRIDNGNLTTATLGTGAAGNIDLNVSSVSAIGGDLVTGINSSTQGSGQGGNITIIGDRLKLEQGAVIAADSTNLGTAGNITITSQELVQLEDRGSISVNGGTLGTPGDIKIYSGEINLERAATISSTTTQGEQGNINLTADNLWLRDRSQIVTNASQAATGGNINLDLNHNLLVRGQSNITANAEQGQGGEIQISATGVFVSADSEINANSQFGVDGLIQVDTLAIAPNTGLISLPSQTIDPNQYLAPSCSPEHNNHFTHIGQGGIAANPLANLMDQTFLPDWNQSPLEVTQSPEHKLPREPLPTPTPLIEAQSWKINRHGKVELIAAADQSEGNIVNHSECFKNQTLLEKP